MGVLQGLTREEIRVRYPDVYSQQEQEGFYDLIPGGESATDRREP